MILPMLLPRSHSGHDPGTPRAPRGGPGILPTCRSGSYWGQYLGAILPCICVLVLAHPSRAKPQVKDQQLEAQHISRCVSQSKLLLQAS